MSNYIAVEYRVLVFDTRQFFFAYELNHLLYHPTLQVVSMAFIIGESRNSWAVLNTSMDAIAFLSNFFYSYSAVLLSDQYDLNSS